jgi:hypothetical protein
MLLDHTIDGRSDDPGWLLYRQLAARDKPLDLVLISG